MQSLDVWLWDKYDTRSCFLPPALCAYLRTGGWGKQRNAGADRRGQPDKLGVVSVDRISGGFLQACVEPRVWIIEKRHGERKGWKTDWRKTRVSLSSFPIWDYFSMQQIRLYYVCTRAEPKINSITGLPPPHKPHPPFLHHLYDFTTSGGSFLIYNSKIYAFTARPSCTLIPALSPFINETSVAISHFMAMNSCGFSQEESSRETERVGVETWRLLWVA